MAAGATGRHTPEEYLALEGSAEFRSEYIARQIVPMPSAETRAHNLIVSALVGQLGRHLIDGPWEVYCSIQRVKVTASGDYLYPDVVVSCDPRFEAGAGDNLLTPSLVIEVLSDSTEQRDRGKKFELYQRMESVREYVLVSQKKVLVEQYVREGKSWRFGDINDIDASLNLASVGIAIPLRRLYQKALAPTRRGPADPHVAEGGSAV
jgi:Uma2 family endonuclease